MKNEAISVESGVCANLKLTAQNVLAWRDMGIATS